MSRSAACTGSSLPPAKCASEVQQYARGRVAPCESQRQVVSTNTALWLHCPGFGTKSSGLREWVPGAELHAEILTTSGTIAVGSSTTSADSSAPMIPKLETGLSAASVGISCNISRAIGGHSGLLATVRPSLRRRVRVHKAAGQKARDLRLWAVARGGVEPPTFRLSGGGKLTVPASTRGLFAAATCSNELTTEH